MTSVVPSLVCAISAPLNPQGDPLLTSRVLSLYSSLLPSTLPCELQWPLSLWLLSSISSPQRLYQGLKGFLLSLQLGNSPMAVNWSNHGAHTICSLTVRDHCPLLPNTQCLENYCFMYFVWFSVSCQRVNCLPVTPSLPEAEAQYLILSKVALKFFIFRYSLSFWFFNI